MRKTKWAKALFGIALTALMATTITVSTFLFQSDATQEAIVKMGSSGSDVKAVQSKLKELGFYQGSLDGIFGSQTSAAVRSFQKSKGLNVDGVVGPKTATALGVKLSSGSTGNSGYSGSDVYLLAKCIYAEARGEPYIGQVAVGAVVLNRVQDPEFPNSISGVVYQPWAFTAVNDGQINLEPNDSAKRAAKDALSGWDPTNGCIYYYNPAKTTNKWIWSRPVQLVIGKHRFAI